MADSLTIKANYKTLIRKLFPLGWAWRINPGTVFDEFIDSLTGEPCRVEERSIDFLDELNPATTFEMLDNWERLLGIPDECTREGDLGVSERRTRILQKLTTGGGQSPSFYQLIAQQLGYEVEIFDVLNYQSFRVGISRVGDPLSNGADWAFTWQVVAPADFVRRFRVGLSSVGEPLVLIENTTLECVIRKFAPAHTQVLFSYVD